LILKSLTIDKYIDFVVGLTKIVFEQVVLKQYSIKDYRIKIYDKAYAGLNYSRREGLKEKVKRRAM